MRRILTIVVCALFAIVAAERASASGLLVPTDRNLPPLRITDHLVDVTIRDRVALTTLTQTFHNDTEQRLEGTYIFPLPEEADLTNFQMTFNGKMVEGEVLPADEARQIYESIVRQAKDPGLIEFIGRRLLRMRVFPIEPKSDTTIKLSYQQVCTPISEMIGYHYPLRTNTTNGQAFGTLRFDISLDSTQPVKNIWSPTHAVEIVRDGDYKARIAYEAAGGSLEQDFILLYNTDASDLGLSVIAHKPEENVDGHFLLMLTPKQLWPENEYQPQDVVFVVDTSGSMGGEKIKQAREALKFCVDQLDERDRFSVVRFSTGFDVLFDEVAEATLGNRTAAKQFIEKFEATGGTNIADTLQFVAGMNPNDDARPFVIVFITDGQGNRTPDEILAVLQSTTADDASVRIFPFGVGDNVNTMLLDRLSNSYHGKPTYVQPGQNLELVLGDFFSTISQPVLTNLRLSLPNIGTTERFPVTLGDLYHGQQLTIAGKFSKPLAGNVKLTAKRNGQDVEYVWPDVHFENTDNATYVAPIWAGRKIAWMIDEIRLHGENDEMIKEIVALSQEYGIQTPYTSWLVAPEGRPSQTITRFREDRLRRMPAARRALEAMPGGGGGRGGGGGFGGERGRGAGAPAAPPARDAAGEELYDLSLEEAEQAVTAATGRDATIIAGYQAKLRDASNTEAGVRLDLDSLPMRKIGKITYIRVGPFLVDPAVDEKRELVAVRFASDAYFDLVASKPALRALFAASRNVVIPAGKKHAIVVVDEKGEGVLESFTDDQREQFGLSSRISD